MLYEKQHYQSCGVDQRNISERTQERSTVCSLGPPNPLEFTDDGEGALHQFIECVEISSPEARHQVHTLSFTNIAPPFVSWSSEHVGWLCDLLDSLSNLQSLLIHRSALVDQAVVRFLSFGPTITLNATPSPKTWYLSVLRLTGLVGVTPDCLGAAMPCFPQLVYLDLSYSNVAGKYPFIQSVCGARFILTLKILKLRGVGLADRSVSLIAMAIGTGLWSLDVRDNNLTDAAVQALLDHCVLPPDYAYSPKPAQELTENTSNCAQDDQEAFVLNQIYKCQRTSGLTHLRISNNDISAGAVVALAKTARLLVLDCSRQRGLGVNGYYRRAATHDAVKAVEVLRELAENEFASAGSLRHLRINHQLVTGDSALLDTLDKDIAATFMLNGNHWPRWVSNDAYELMTRTALPTMGLRTLVLTGLPYTSHTGWIAKGLVAFLNHCASLESCATENAADFQNSPKPHNTSNAQSAAETSRATDAYTIVNPQNGAGAQYLTEPQAGAGPGCPPYLPSLETPVTAPEPMTPKASEPAVQPQLPAPHLPPSNSATAGPRLPTRTILRSIYLEIDPPPPAELEGFDMHTASKGDFSFFATDSANQGHIETDEQPEENPWRGDLIPVLRAHKARAEHIWSGNVFAVYK